jgi:outer membrane receptor protein involved in Fe transport
MKAKKLLCPLFVVLSLMTICAPPLLAQSAGTAALTGTVTDATGAVVPNATVTLTNTGTNQTRTATTGSDGAYRFNLIEPGTYRARFGATGFKTAEVASITVNVTETVGLDRSLEVGAQTEQVTVEASTETLQTASSTLGTTVPGNTMTALPLSNRNFTQVLGMSTGVAVDVGNGAGFGRGSANMSVNGANPEKNNFQMDGVAINNAAGNNQAGDNGLYTGITVPNPDAIQEFKIQTSTYDASYGRNPGANVNVVTKSGTNQIHGSLFEFFRNEALNANDFFYNRDNPASRTTKQVLKQNQFGGVFGGPIKKDKLFYFGSYQGTRQRNGVAPQGFTTAVLYPVPDNREAADFQSRLGAAMCGFAPARGMRISCDGSNINPVAVALLRVKLPSGSYYIPGSGTSGTAQRFFSVPAKYSEDQYIANADWIVSEKHSLAMKYMFSDNPYVYQLSGAAGQLPGDVQTDHRANTSAVLRLTSLLSSSMVNQARASFQRVIQDGSDTSPYTPQQIGLKPLVDIRCCNGTTGGTYTQPPPILIGGTFAVGGRLSPSFAPSNQTQWADEISWNKGSHTLRAGFEYENIRYPLVFGGLGRGQLLMPSFADFLIGRAGCSPSNSTCSVTNPGVDPNGYPTNGSPLSNFLSCLFCVRSGVNGIIHNYHLKNISTFFQDDWKVNSRLTLNLGVRWEYDGVLSDKYGNLTNLWASDLRSVPIPPSAPSLTDPKAYTGYVVPSNYDPVAHGPLPPGVRQFDGEYTTENGVPLNNFAPRIGFAWQPGGNGRFVVRGGAGMFYDRVGINRLVHAVQEGKPYADTTAIQNDIASLQSPYQDRPLALAPRWYNFQTLLGSNLNSPFYDRLHTPLIRQYNLGIQYEFVRNYVLEAAFVGSSGINIGDYNHNVNTAKLASPSNPINGFTTNTSLNAGGRVPYLGFQPNGLQQNAFDGVYNYNSLQLTVRKQFSHGFSFQGAYTWSKNLSDVGFDAANINNSTDLWNQYGQTPFSRPHRFVLNYQYDLPFKSNGALGRVVGGWGLAGLTVIQSGNPLTLFDNRAGSAFGTPGSGTIEQSMDTATLCPGATFSQIETSGNVKDRLGSASNLSATRFFNAGVFCAPPVIGADGVATGFGNTGIGIVRGPHQLNFDFQVSKLTRISERQSLQFRAEFFNLFNHAQFSIPSYTLQPSNNFVNNGTLFTNGASFGVINQTSVAPRLIQLALKYSF